MTVLYITKSISCGRCRLIGDLGEKSNAQKSNYSRPLSSSCTLALWTADFNPLNAISLYTSAANRWASEASNVRCASPAIYRRELELAALECSLMPFCADCIEFAFVCAYTQYVARVCTKVPKPKRHGCIRSDMSVEHEGKIGIMKIWFGQLKMCVLQNHGWICGIFYNYISGYAL